MSLGLWVGRAVRSRFKRTSILSRFSWFTLQPRFKLFCFKLIWEQISWWAPDHNTTDKRRPNNFQGPIYSWGFMGTQTHYPKVWAMWVTGSLAVIFQSRHQNQSPYLTKIKRLQKIKQTQYKIKRLLETKQPQVMKQVPMYQETKNQSRVSLWTNQALKLILTLW